jgi:hypothetical protein
MIDHKDGFLTKLIISRHGESKNYQYMLENDLTYADKETRLTVVIEKGFFTDLATIPRFFKPIIDNDDYEIAAPAVMHDYLYSNPPKHIWFNRKIADQILYRAMINMGSSTWKAYLVYNAVRLFAGKHYND